MSKSIKTFGPLKNRRSTLPNDQQPIPDEFDVIQLDWNQFNDCAIDDCKVCVEYKENAHKHLPRLIAYVQELREATEKDNMVQCRKCGAWLHKNDLEKEENAICVECYVEDGS